MLLRMGNWGDAVKVAREGLQNDALQVSCLEVLVEALWKLDQREEAVRTLEILRGLAVGFDDKLRMWERVEVVRRFAKMPEKWMQPISSERDVKEAKERTASAGVKFWEPRKAPDW